MSERERGRERVSERAGRERVRKRAGEGESEDSERKAEGERDEGEIEHAGKCLLSTTAVVQQGVGIVLSNSGKNVPDPFAQLQRLMFYIIYCLQ